MKLRKITAAVSLVTLGLFAAAGCFETGSSSSSGSSSEGKKWRAPVKLSGETSAREGKIVIDGAGNALAVWFTDDHLWSSLFAKGNGWGGAEKIDDATLRVADYSLDMNQSGLAAVLWRSEEDTGDYFKTRLFSVEGGWDDEVKLMDGLNSDGQRTDVAVAETGAVVAVWARYSLGNQVQAGVRGVEGEWGEAPSRVDEGAFYSNAPQIAADGAGNAVAVWEQWNGERTVAYARYYSASQGWKDAAFIRTLSAGDATVDEVFLAINADGEGVAYWTQNEHTQLYARRFTNDVWEEAPVLIGATNGAIYNPAASVTPEGDIVAIWYESANDSYQVRGKSFVVGEGWDGSLTLVSDQTNDDQLDGLTFAANADGDAIALWSRTGVDASCVYARRWTPAGGWAGKIETAYKPAEGFGAAVTSAKLDAEGRVAAMVNVFDLPDYEFTSVRALLFY